MEKIGAIIRKHRIAKGLTQEELGKRVFVSKQAVPKWETGRSLPDIEMVRQLCDILEINRDEILGGSIVENKKNRKLFKVLSAISAVCFLLALFFALDGFGYIERRTQWGVAYLSVFWDDALLEANKYGVDGNQVFESLGNGYKADIDYGEIRGTVSLSDGYDIEFGFVNTNNWHNVHIRLDIETQSSQLIVKQTVSYETDDNIYQVIVTENTTAGNQLSVYQEGV